MKYALAKIAGLKLCKYINEELDKNFISIMPSNVFGINDNDPNDSHVLEHCWEKFTKKCSYAKK